jgi:hypothetical protein
MRETINSGESGMVSRTMLLQLRCLISKEMVHLEFMVLSEAEKLVFGPMTLGRANLLAMWVCLWTIIFSYKDVLVLTRALLLCPGKLQILAGWT